ncbi:hypothetical protein RJZ90_001066 [Blastomyces dermatitidis]
MAFLSEAISTLRSFLATDEIIEPTSDQYASETNFWSVYNNPKPQLVLRPKSLPALQRTVEYLCASDLDFAVRSGGNNTAGTKDVQLSMSAFDAFEFDRGSETVTIGAGQTWGEVDRKMEEEAPGYTVLSTRVPFVGVAGSLLVGGMSWFSGEYGLCSDPQNLLDAHVVLPDGRMIWASTEPELLWALRGGGGNFGVVSAFKIKVYRCPQKILAGTIAFPKTAIKAVSKGASDFVKRLTDPKLAAHVVVMNFDPPTGSDAIPQPSIAINIFDAHGEEHGRSELGFKWAFDIEGAVDMTKEMTIREVNDSTASLRMAAGNTIMLSSPLVGSESIDPDFVVRMAEFYKEAVETNRTLGSGSLIVLEILGKGTLTSAGGAAMTAWPRTKPQHVLQFALMHPPEADCPAEVVSGLLEKAPTQICPAHKPSEYWPAFIQEFQDLSQALRACPRRRASVRPAVPGIAATAARRCYASESKPARAQAHVDLDVDVAMKTGQKSFVEQTGVRPQGTTVLGTAASGDGLTDPSSGILKQATVLEQGNRPIYLDMQATTPTDPRVLDAMLPFLTGFYGNPHSRTHAYGWETEKATEQAREHVASLIGADPKEIIFTSGATESNNMSIKGVAKFFGRSGKKKHLITSQTEHKCVLDSCRHLQDEGFEVTYLPVQSNGLINLKDLEAAIRPETALVSIMTVNNEIGVIQPVKEIGALCRSKKVFFHTDAAQAVGKIPINVNEWNVDLLSISGHKIYGPKGIGACYVRRRPRVRLDPIITGGGQERGLRSGTLAPHLAVGIGEACRIAKEEMEYDAKRIKALSKRLLDGLLAMEHTTLNGDPEEHYPGCVNVSFAYVEGESLLMALKDIALSSGSACTSASLEPSYVLRALGNSDESAHSSIRFGIGRFTTEREIDYVLQAVRERVSFLRELSPLWELVQEGVDLNTIEWSQH